MEKMPSPPRRRKHARFLILTIALASAAGTTQQTSSPSSSPISAAETRSADSFQRKIDYIEQNAQKNPPDERPTTVTEAEINAYFAQRRLKLPDGVKLVKFDLQPGAVNALTRVDFDEITKSRHSWNPLLALFTGVHDAQVMAHAHGSGGRVQVHVDSVTLDGVNVPRVALELFIEKFVNPKYPTVRLDGEYKLPVKIDSVNIGAHESTVIQKQSAE
jgi:hypothetical protein